MKSISILFLVFLVFLSVVPLTVSQVKNDVNKLGLLPKTLPDIVGTKVNIMAPDGSELISGKNVLVVCVMNNKAEVHFNAYFSIDIYMDGILIAEDQRASLSTVATNFDWIAQKGTHTAKCMLDTHNEVNELNENNNQATKTFSVKSAPTSKPDNESINNSINTVPARLTPNKSNKPIDLSNNEQLPPSTVANKPDLTIEKFRVIGKDGKGVIPEKESNIYCYWKRTGRQPLKVFGVLLKMDGTIIESSTVDYTKTNGWISGPWIAKTGKHNIFCEVDYENTIPETDERNNKLDQVYSIPTMPINYSIH